MSYSQLVSFGHEGYYINQAYYVDYGSHRGHACYIDQAYYMDYGSYMGQGYYIDKGFSIEFSIE